MPYYPSSPHNVFIVANDKPDGYIELSDDGYWDATVVMIDSISVRTASTDWDLYLCTDSSYNMSSVTTRQLVSGGLTDSIIDIGEQYSSDDLKVYVVYLDNNGTATASFYVVGRSM
jgi:hypothetical protein